MKLKRTLALVMALCMLIGMVPVVGVSAEEYPAITLDTEQTVTISEEGEIAYFAFTPAHTESYTFYSFGDSDTYGHLYDSEMNQLTYNDDGAGNGQFSITYDLEAGQTYILGARFYSSSATGSFSVMLKANHYSSTEGVVSKEPTCTEDGIMIYTCDMCGAEFTEAIPASHDWGTEELICIRCGEEFYAEGTYGDNLIWVLDKTGTLTISGTGQMYNWSYSVNIPWYDYREMIKTVVLEDGVSSIGNYAFRGCSSLTSVDLGDSVTSIGNYAFYSCSSLTSIDLPDSVTSIGYNAFSYCSSLTSVDLGNSLASIGAWAFNDCSSLTSVDLGDGVTSIGKYAFYECSSLTSIALPDSVTSIGDCAFEYCRNLASIDLPDSLISIGDDTFFACSSLTSVDLGDRVTSIGDDAFHGCSSLASIALPDSVISIGDFAFHECSSLTSVDLGDGVTSIGNYAFYSCSSLTSIDLPDSLTSIGDCAFEYCRNLASIALPDSVTSIGDYAFEDCSSLTGIYVAENNQNYSNDSYGVLYNKQKTTLIQAPGAISGSYAIPDSVTSIGDYAFCGCSSLTSVDLGNSVTSIGYAAFSRCSSLTSIGLPDSVISIGHAAFYDCSSLTSIDLPDSLTFIGERAFANCCSLASIDLPDGITTIRYSTFEGCSDLVSVNLPDSLKKISYSVFAGCSSLTDIALPDGIISIGNSTFSDCDSLTHIEIPASLTFIDDALFADCTSLQEIVFKGDAPVITDTAFIYVTATAYYPAGNESWTTDVMQDYGGNITWIAIPEDCLTGNHVFTNYISDGNGTCLADGTKTAKCDYCAATDTVADPDSKTDHRYSHYVHDADSNTSTAYCDYGCGVSTTVAGYPVIIADTAQPVTIVEGGERAYFAFTPKYTESYTFSSSGDWDTYGYLYDSEMNELDHDDDSAGNRQFSVTYTLQAGETYIFAARLYSSGTTGSFSVMLKANHSSAEGVVIKEATCIEEGRMSCVCDVCGESFTQATPTVGHSWGENYTCTVCKYAMPVIAAETETTANITKDGETAYFRYTPAYTESYTFYADSYSDTYGYLYDSNMNQLGYDDDSRDGDDFSITYTLEAGKTYVLGAKYYYSSGTGEFSVFLTANHSSAAGGVVTKEVTCVEDGIITYICDACGTEYIEVIPGGHSWDDDNHCSKCNTDLLLEGTCGYELTWVLDHTGTLTISGTGYMYDYEHGFNNPVPWYDYKDRIKSVVVQSGVTVIGEEAFSSCCNLTSVSFPDTLVVIDDFAFNNCNKLSDLSLPENLEEIGAYAFSDCAGLSIVWIPDSVKIINQNAFDDCENLRVIVFTADAPEISMYALGYDFPTNVCYPANNSTWENVNMDSYGGKVKWYAMSQECMAGNHVFTNYVSDYNASCQANGTKTAICDHCGMVDIVSIDGSQTTHAFSHYVYDAQTDTSTSQCDFGCGTTDTINGHPILTATVERVISITEPNMCSYFSYTPAYTESHTFYAIQNPYEVVDTCGFIYDSDMNLLVSCDDVKTNKNFSITYTLEAGKTYIFGAKYYNTSQTGSFSVVMKINHTGDANVVKKPASCIENGVMAGICEVCGVEYFVDVEAYGHTWDEGELIVPATCTEHGRAKYTCTVCEATTTDVVFGNHEWTKDFVCVNCGENRTPSGTCGDNVTWVLDQNGTLTISGTGEMANYYNWDGTDDPAPWYDYRKCISNVIIEPGVTTIGDYAFMDCRLDSIVIPESVTRVGNRAFFGCDLKKISLPDSVTHIGSGAFEYSTLTQITIPKGMTTINDSAFYCAFELSSVTIPDTVTSIGPLAFMYCESLKSIDIPDSVTRIGNSAFSCAGLTSVSIPEGITELETYVFDACFQLASITLPDTLTTIGYHAFDSCRKLSSITIPAGVTMIDSGAFADCSGLGSITFLGNAPEVKIGNVFENVISIAYYPAGNATWTPYMMKDHGGDITWVAQYEVLDGDGSVVQLGDTPELEIRAVGEIEKFEGVTVDGELVDPSNYTVTEGSTIITFKPEYLKTLEEGDHTIQVHFTDGVAIAKVSVKKPVYILGDVNSDGQVNGEDRLALTRYLAKWTDYPASVINMDAADVNSDGKVNAQDRLILTRHLAMWTGYETLG